MSDFQTEMNQVVRGFVSRIAELAHRAVIDKLGSTLPMRRGEDRETVVGLPPGHAATGRPRGSGGARRTPQDLKNLSSRFLSFVKSRPGLRIEQINEELGTTTKDLALPIRKLLERGGITTTGRKRATRYFSGRRITN